MKDRASGKSRGFGFVTYWSAADAQRVLEGNHVVDGRRCEVRNRASQLLRAGPHLPYKGVHVSGGCAGERAPQTTGLPSLRQF